MSKFEFELELQGFKVRMKGERAQIPLIAQTISKQVENLIAAPASMTDGKPQLPLPIAAGPIIDVPTSGGSRRRRVGKATKSTEVTATADVVIDPMTWGAPTQKWTTTDKAIWLLYVVANCGGANEMTSAQIANNFNAKFREAGMVLRQNVNRDLIKLKGAADGLVGRSDQTDAWFLTDAGKKQAISLISAVRDQAAPGAS